MKRREFIVGSAGVVAGAALPAAAQPILPARDPAPLIADIAGPAGARSGRVSLDLPALAENGNSVPLRLRVDSPMNAADHVRSVHVLAPRNPRPLVAVFRFGPAAARAEIGTRIRLAGTQRVVAVAAMSDGSFWFADAEVVVTAAACLDEGAG